MNFLVILLFVYPFLCHSSLPPNASAILNTTRIFPLSPLLSTLSPNVSRDAPFILHLPPLPGSKLYKPFWIFSDTETFNLQGSQSGFVSNSAAWDNSDREGILDAVLMGKNPNLPLRVTDVAVTSGGAIRNQWIPHTGEEIAFNNANRKTANSGLWDRLALWPNCPPTAINQTHAILYCSIIEVKPPPAKLNATMDSKAPKDEDVGWLYRFKGISLVLIVRENITLSPDEELRASKPHEALTPSRLVPKLFTDKEVSWGNFGALVGHCSLGTQGNQGNGTCIYTIAIGGQGLMLASVPLDKLAEKKSYTYFDADLREFRSISPTHDSVKAPFLNGTFSSGNLFFSDMYQTFLIVYFNRLVDNSFYIRFLDREHPITLVKEGKSYHDVQWPANKTLTAADVEAVGHYTWSQQYKLYETKQGKGGFSYAGNVGMDYFSGLGEQKEDGKNTSWVLLTWTEQTGEKIGYKTGGAVVGFSKKLINTTVTYNSVAWEDEIDLLDEVYRLPWDTIYSRPEPDIKTSGSRSAIFHTFGSTMLVPMVVYVFTFIPLAVLCLCRW